MTGVLSAWKAGRGSPSYNWAAAHGVPLEPTGLRGDSGAFIYAIPGWAVWLYYYHKRQGIELISPPWPKMIAWVARCASNEEIAHALIAAASADMPDSEIIELIEAGP